MGQGAGAGLEGGFKKVMVIQAVREAVGHMSVPT